MKTNHTVAAYGLILLSSALLFLLVACAQSQPGSSGIEASPTPTVTPDGSEGVSIPDRNLEAAIRLALGKSVGEITVAELATLKYLHAEGRDISNLSGIQYCSNLTGLDLSNNRIRDISPLAALVGLAWLDLFDNQVSDVAALEPLTNLAWLDLGGNAISDITALAENEGLAEADWVSLTNTPLDVSEGSRALQSIQALSARGVLLSYDK